MLGLHPIAPQPLSHPFRDEGGRLKIEQFCPIALRPRPQPSNAQRPRSRQLGLLLLPKALEFRLTRGLTFALEALVPHLDDAAKRPAPYRAPTHARLAARHAEEDPHLAKRL